MQNYQSYAKLHNEATGFMGEMAPGHNSQNSISETFLKKSQETNKKKCSTVLDMLIC